MKRALLSLCAAFNVASGASMAGAATEIEYRPLAPFQTSFELFKSHNPSGFAVGMARLIPQPTRIKVTPRPCSGGEGYDGCSDSTELSHVKAIEVQVRYFDPSGEGEWVNRPLYLNPKTLPASVVNQITQRGVQGSSVFRVKKDLVVRRVPSVDERRSVFCPESSGCTERIKYKMVNVEKLNVSVVPLAK